MFINSIKEVIRLRKEIMRMSNDYLKFTIEKNCNFPSLKKLSPSLLMRAATHKDIIEFYKFFLQLRNYRSGSKTVSYVSIILILKRTMF